MTETENLLKATTGTPTRMRKTRVNTATVAITRSTLAKFLQTDTRCGLSITGAGAAWVGRWGGALGLCCDG